jgi:AcrR family transcriptional regulator
MTDKTTHDKIIEVAIRTFAELGYAGTSMREIAEELGITKAALYYHFPGKEEIFKACLSHSVEQLIDGIEDIASAKISVWDKINMLTNGMCTFSESNPYLFMLFKKLMANEEDVKLGLEIMQDFFQRQKNALQTIFEDGVRNNELRDDVPINLLSSAMMGMIHHTTGPKMREMNHLEQDPEEYTDELLKLIRGGFEKR